MTVFLKPALFEEKPNLSENGLTKSCRLIWIIWISIKQARLEDYSFFKPKYTSNIHIHGSLINMIAIKQECICGVFFHSSVKLYAIYWLLVTSGTKYYGNLHLRLCEIVCAYLLDKGFMLGTVLWCAVAIMKSKI